MKKRFNYAEAEELLEKYGDVEDVPEEVLKQLNIDSKDPDAMEWFEENFGYLQIGAKSKKDFEDGERDMMYPEGNDDD